MKTKLLKLLAVMTISITALLALGITASAETVGDFTITLTEGGGDPVVDTDYTYVDYDYAPGVLTIKSSEAMTISGTTTNDRIVVAYGVSANITLNGVNIDTSNASGAAFVIADNSTGNVTITLADGTTNTLKSVVNCAGLQKNGEYSETLGKLTITGTGTLTATGGDKGAGIGGGGGGSSSNIEISGGKVTATGGGYGAGTGGDFGGAGIGGGKNGSGSNIEISGGTVKAQGGYRAAGIGGGGGGSSSNIEISGGTVTATGGSGGAGIGGGWICSGSDIKISGGTVTATGGEYGAGIGGGFEANGSNIEISGGVVIANGGGGSNGGAGIGGGGGGSTDNIKISGGTVKADTIGCTPTDGTANATPVYPLELDVDGTSAVTINGKAYPTKHIDENKLYVYLPAGNYTVANGNSQKLYTIADDGTVSEVNAEDPVCTCTAKCTEDNKNTECPVCNNDYSACEYIPTSGNCGADGNEQNVIWNFDTATGTLTISGTGAMADYDIFYGYPVWSQFYRESIKKIVIGYGVTRIGTDAFYDCLNAEEVVFERNENGESSVTSIGNYAFWTIEELNNIVVPASVETIGDNVFRSCNSLTSIVFEEGSSLGTIGTYSFHNVKNSEECIIPSKVTSIGERAFRDNEDLKHFYYPAGVNFGTNVFYEDSLLEYFGEYTVNENDKTCSISYIGVGQNEYDYYPDENEVITASEIVIPEKIDGYKVTSVEIGEIAVNIPPESFEAPHTTTKLSDITVLEGWEYEAETDEIPAGGLVNVTLRSYKISDTQKFTITSKTVTVSRAVCVDEEKNHSCDLCGAVISGCEEYMSDWSSAETEHQRTCTYCGKIESAAHISSGAATPNKAETCTVCGYEITPATGYVSAPTFTPASGTTFTSTQNVTIACATDGATIYYTTDGSTPTTASTKYTGAITITSTTTIKAIAVKDGMGDSSVVTAKYTKNSGGSGGSGGGSGGGGGYRPPVVPDDDDDDNDDVVVNDPEDNEDKSDNGNEPQIKGDNGNTGWDAIPDDDDDDNDDVVVNDPEDNEDKSDNGNEPQVKSDNGNTGWDAILDELDDADEGDKIVVDMNGETEVPEDVFEQIKGQDIDLVIELDNGFIWTINGKDVTNPADIDLGVNKGSTIPVRAINAVTGECEYITITLAHNGEFGFKAVLTVDMGVKNEGYFANLYWYTDNDTKFICADKIDNKGRANLVFTHASEYVIVIDENDHTPEDDVSAGAGIEEDSSEIPDDFDNDENPYTGVVISFAIIIISAATIMIARKRKKQ